MNYAVFLFTPTKLSDDEVDALKSADIVFTSVFLDYAALDKRAVDALKGKPMLCFIAFHYYPQPATLSLSIVREIVRLFSPSPLFLLSSHEELPQFALEALKDIPFWHLQTAITLPILCSVGRKPFYWFHYTYGGSEEQYRKKGTDLLLKFPPLLLLPHILNSANEYPLTFSEFSDCIAKSKFTLHPSRFDSFSRTLLCSLFYQTVPILLFDPNVEYLAAWAKVRYAPDDPTYKERLFKALNGKFVFAEEDKYAETAYNICTGKLDVVCDCGKILSDTENIWRLDLFVERLADIGIPFPFDIGGHMIATLHRGFHEIPWSKYPFVEAKDNGAKTVFAY